MVYLAAIGRTLALIPWTLALAVSVACIPEESGETPTTPTSSEGKKLTKEQEGEKLIEEAKTAFGEGNFAMARERLKAADDLDIQAQRVAVSDFRDKIDRAQAKFWADQTKPKFKANDCAAALRKLHDPLATLGTSKVFVDELRRLVSSDAHACIDEAVDAKLRTGGFSAARDYLNSEDIKAVLGEESLKKLVASVDLTIVEALRAKVESDVSAHHYREAFDKIDAMKKTGEANEEQASKLRDVLREAAAGDLVAQAKAATGQPEAAKVLRQVDQAIKVLGWEMPAPDTEAGEGAPPAELIQARADLAASVGSVRTEAKPPGKKSRR